MHNDVPSELLRGVARLNDIFQTNRHGAAVTDWDDACARYSDRQKKAANILAEAHAIANPETQRAITATLITLNEQPLHP